MILRFDSGHAFDLQVKCLAEALSRIERHGRSGVIFFYTIIEVYHMIKAEKLS
jgi:hypothetical protein